MYCDLRVASLFLFEAVDANNGAFSRFNLKLMTLGRLLNLPLHIARLNGCNHAS